MAGDGFSGLFLEREVVDEEESDHHANSDEYH